MSRATYQVSLPHTSQAALFYLRLSSTTGTISQWTSVIDMVPIRQQSAIESLMREDWKSPAGPNALSLRSTYEQGNSNTGIRWILHIKNLKNLNKTPPKRPTTLIRQPKNPPNNPYTHHTLLPLSLAPISLLFHTSTLNVHPQPLHAFHSTPLSHQPASVPHFPFHLRSNLLPHLSSNTLLPNTDIPYPNIPFPISTEFSVKMSNSSPPCFQSRGIDVPI